MESIDENKVNGSTDPIVPIDFTPNQDKGEKFSFRFRWLHLFLILFLAMSGSAAWFVLTAKSIAIDVTPLTASIQLEGGLAIKMGPRFLVREGVYEISLTNEGYHDLTTNLFVTDQQSQSHPIEMRRLPGLVTIEVLSLEGARVQIDSVDIGVTPLVDVPVEAGKHEMLISRDRYLPAKEQIVVEGRSIRERFELELAPAWAVVSLVSEPAAAEVLIDGVPVGFTPMNAEVLQGDREFTIKLAGHKAWQGDISIEAGRDLVIPGIVLEAADGLVFIRSNPSNASVTISGEFKGQTPLEVALTPGERHEITLFKAGYASGTRSIQTAPDEETELNIKLEPVMASVRVQASPEDAQLYINGEFRGLANQTLELMAVSQQIEIRKQGYVPHTAEFTSRPGLEQVIRVTLKSLEQERLEKIKPVITTLAGQTLKLFYPGTITMGASRREAGRRPNESIREVTLEQPFYFSLYEVTNGEYKKFKADHSSGTFQSQPLGLDLQPVTQVNWNDAALYCNWLSKQEGLPLFYQETDGEVVGFDPQSTGYRLPSEAEWAWIARFNGSEAALKYSWGDQLQPPDGAGNFADVTAQAYLGQVLFDYNDSYLGSAPVGDFTPNYHGVYDMAGNVAEWVHDFYGTAGSLGGATEVDPLGLQSGQYHTIRGSSWTHGSITELRLSFRDFGEEQRNDLGFRIARYLGE